MKTTILMTTILSSLIWVATASAMDVKLQWDPNTETDLAGYKVYYGIDGLASPSQLDVSNQTSATVAALDPGQNYSFAVTAYNTSGLESGYSNIVAIAESVAPVVSIASPSNGGTVSSAVSVNVSASDNVGVTRTELYVNGVLSGTANAAPYSFSWDASALAAGNYSLTAKAYDAAGNVGQSTAVTVAVVRDTTAPVVSISGPANASTVSGTVTVSASATDNVGVSRVEFYENGALRAAVNTPPYSYSWDTTAVADGAHTLFAKAFDAAGNVGQSATVAANVDNSIHDSTAPTVSTFTIPATSTSMIVPVSSFVAGDNIGVTGYLITESAATPAASAAGWTASAPTSFTFSAAGSKTAYAWAKDAAGNVSATRSANVTITLSDTTAPTVTLSSPSNNATVTGTVSVSANASDNVGVTKVEFYVNSVLKATITTAPYGFSWDTTSIANGPCTIAVMAFDAAGNVKQSSNVLVTVTNLVPDIKAPTVAIAQVASPTTSSAQTLTGTVSDNVAVAGVTVQIGSGTAAAATVNGTTWSYTASGLVVGTNQITVRATDSSGNASTATASIVVESPTATTSPLAISDALVALQIAVGKVQPTGAHLSRLDVAPVINGKSVPNGKIDTGDAIVILSKVVGKIAL